MNSATLDKSISTLVCVFPPSQRYYQILKKVKANTLRTRGERVLCRNLWPKRARQRVPNVESCYCAASSVLSDSNAAMVCCGRVNENVLYDTIVSFFPMLLSSDDECNTKTKGSENSTVLLIKQSLSLRCGCRFLEIR
jgi:hypothetical protein